MTDDLDDELVPDDPTPQTETVRDAVDPAMPAPETDPESETSAGSEPA